MELGNGLFVLQLSLTCYSIYVIIRSYEKDTVESRILYKLQGVFVRCCP